MRVGRRDATPKLTVTALWCLRWNQCPRPKPRGILMHSRLRPQMILVSRTVSVLTRCAGFPSFHSSTWSPAWRPSSTTNTFWPAMALVWAVIGSNWSPLLVKFLRTERSNLNMLLVVAVVVVMG